MNIIKHNKFLNYFWLILVLALDLFLFKTISVFKKRRNRDAVLFIRLNAIGDAAIWLHSAVNYKNIYKDQKKVLLCNALWADLHILKEIFDEIIPLDMNRFTYNYVYHLRMLMSLSATKYTELINTVFSKDFFTEMSICYHINADKKIGLAGDNANQKTIFKKISNSIYSDIVDSGKTLPVHEFYRNNLLCRHLTGHDAKLESFKNCFLPEKHKIDLPENYCVLFVGAADQYRAWTIENFIEIVHKLQAEYSGRIIICGSKADSGKAEAISAKCKKIIDMTGRTDINDLFIVIVGADFLLSNETSATHIATALDVPNICIAGGGHFNRFVPYPDEFADNISNFPIVVSNKKECFGCNWHCKYADLKKSDAPCILSISIDEVWTAVSYLLRSKID